jgi:hypothetical protein
MKYLCLAYYDVDACARLSPQAQQDLTRECGTRDQALRAHGQLVTVASLAEDGAMTLQPAGGETSVNPGHVVAGNRQVGAIFILDARDLNEAIRVASTHPAACLHEELGWAIELRPIDSFEQAQ